MNRKKVRMSKEDRMFHIVNAVIMSFIFIVMAYPLYFIVIASFSNPDLVYQGKVRLLPAGITFVGYAKTFAKSDLWIAYRNTIFYTVAGTALNIFMTMTAGYALSVKEMYGRRVLMFLITFTMYFGGGMIPTYFVVRSLGILNTAWAMILPCAVSAYNLIITRSFLEANIPKELYEAAELDGCSRLQFFAKVVVPLSGTLIAILVLFYGVGHWNSYFDAMMYIQDRDKFSLQVVLREILLQNSFSVDNLMDADLASSLEQLKNSIKYVIIIVSSIPVLVLYPFLQKYFVKGVMIGSVKG